SITATTQTTLSLSWAASTDNVGVVGYKVYQGTKKIGTTTTTSYLVSGLSCATSYTLGVEAYDAAGNVSPRGTTTASTSACVGGSGGGVSNANLWVATNGSSSCARSATPISFSQAKTGGNVCATMEQACAAAGPGDLVAVKAGAYSADV